MWLILSGILLPALVGCSPASAAASAPPSLLLAPQIPLIDAGAASGALTPGEAQQLRQAADRIGLLRARALRDGAIDAREGAALQGAELDFARHLEALLRNHHVRAGEGASSL